MKDGVGWAREGSLLGAEAERCPIPSACQIGQMDFSTSHPNTEKLHR